MNDRWEEEYDDWMKRPRIAKTKYTYDYKECDYSGECIVQPGQTWFLCKQWQANSESESHCIFFKPHRKCIKASPAFNELDELFEI